MMWEFLRNNRAELEARCRAKVACRPERSASEQQLQSGVPIFLEQLIRTLEMEQSSEPLESHRISGPPGGGLAMSEMGTSAAQHGKELLKLGYSVDQVVHDYGDLCQAITEVAIERHAPIDVTEFRTLNRCLDNAIAEAVREFSYQREFEFRDQQARDANERHGYFAHELRNLLNTVSLAFSAAKAGGLNLSGATGSVMERGIAGLRQLVDASLVDIKEVNQQGRQDELFSLGEFIAEASAAAALSAQAKAVQFHALAVEPTLAICGKRELLLSAVINLLQNAFKFTQPCSEVVLTAYASADRILIDVKDHCGGLPGGVEHAMFLPFAQGGKDRTGLGLGLTISKHAVEASSGVLSVRDIPGSGCVFTINLPRYSFPTP